jgi:hypothetical protein
MSLRSQKSPPTGVSCARRRPDREILQQASRDAAAVSQGTSWVCPARSFSLCRYWKQRLNQQCSPTAKKTSGERTCRMASVGWRPLTMDSQAHLAVGTKLERSGQGLAPTAEEWNCHRVSPGSARTLKHSDRFAFGEHVTPQCFDRPWRLQPSGNANLIASANTSTRKGQVDRPPRRYWPAGRSSPFAVVAMAL